MLFQALDKLQQININYNAFLSDHRNTYKHFTVIPSIPKGFSNLLEILKRK